MIQLESLGVLENTRIFAKYQHLYMECSPEIRATVDEMLDILNDVDASEEEKERATHVIIEALFPSLAVDVCNAYSCVLKSDEAKSVSEDMGREVETFASRLKDAMQEKGITQEWLATQVGVGQPAISMLLNRESRPQKRTVLRIAEAIGIQPDRLWPGISNK